MNEPLVWKEVDRTLLQRCRVFDLYSSRRVNERNGRRAEGTFYLLSSAPWITVVPEVRRGEEGRSFLMVRQYRHGIDRVTVEFPAGLAEAGEQPREAAARELLEETGSRAARMELAGTVAAAPAFLDSWCYTFAATGLQKVAVQQLDDTEVLDVLEVAEEELQERLGTGEYINSITIVSYAQYLAWRRGGWQAEE